MMKPENIIGILGVLATLVGGSLVIIRDALRERRVKAALQRYKLLYVKVYHLRNKETDKPVCERFVPRIGQNVAVYDEIHYYAQHIFCRPQHEFTITDRTSGVVADLQILYPSRELIFADRDAEAQPTSIIQTITEKSNVFLSKATYYNGFQKGHEDIAIRTEVDTEELRLIVDFTSVPNLGRLFHDRPKTFLRTADGTEKEILFESQEVEGLFSVSRKNVKQGDVIRIDFNVNWDGLNGNLEISKKPLASGIRTSVVLPEKPSRRK